MLANTDSNYVYRNTENGFEDVSEEWGVREIDTLRWSRSVTTVDYNKDGFLDVYFSNETGNGFPNSNTFFRNNPNENNWIALKLIGINSNRDAIGSNIRLKTESGWQKRNIHSQSGSRAQAAELHILVLVKTR